MQFTAQGYARLNDRLSPHIAVLEGGYSVETALPYINVGIILAMAGLDYSHVREPDYDPERIRQSADITRYIEKLSEGIYGLWKRRDEEKASFAGMASSPGEAGAFSMTRTTYRRSRRSSCGYATTAAASSPSIPGPITAPGSSPSSSPAEAARPAVKKARRSTRPGPERTGPTITSISRTGTGTST